jgi:hypothetical protein
MSRSEGFYTVSANVDETGDPGVVTVVLSCEVQ